jgi:hypothetical protein
VLGDDVAERVKQELRRRRQRLPEAVRHERPIIPVTTGQRVEVRVPLPALGDLLRDYHLLIDSDDGTTVITFGRVYRGTLFDVHRYCVAEGTLTDSGLEQAIESLLCDKVRENFLPQCGWYTHVAQGDPPPRAVPMDIAARLLVSIV